MNKALIARSCLENYSAAAAAAAAAQLQPALHIHFVSPLHGDERAARAPHGDAEFRPRVRTPPRHCLPRHLPPAGLIAGHRRAEFALPFSPHPLSPLRCPARAPLALSPCPAPLPPEPLSLFSLAFLPMPPTFCDALQIPVSVRAAQVWSLKHRDSLQPLRPSTLQLQKVPGFGGSWGAGMGPVCSVEAMEIRGGSTTARL